jgi:hypothetical protein
MQGLAVHAFHFVSLFTNANLGDLRNRLAKASLLEDAAASRAGAAAEAIGNGKALALSCRDLSRDSKQALMTWSEFSMWATHVIQKVQDLARIFGTNWKFKYMSRYQRQRMNLAHQYEIGLLGLTDMKFRLARDLITYHRELSPESKASIHDRSMSMGEDDPLKPDYTKFLPKKRVMHHSNVVPLDHGYWSIPSD